MATASPPCARCGWQLRWFQPQFSWVCDRCRAVYPSAPAPLRGVVGTAARGAARARPAWRPSPRLLIGTGAAIAIAAVGIVVALVVLRDEGAGAPARTRDELIRRTVAALGAHDAEALMRLSSYDTLRTTMLDCEPTDDARDAARRNRRDMQETFETGIERTRRFQIELGEIDDPDDGRQASPTKLEQGESAGNDCTFKVDATYHDLKFTLKVTAGGKTRVQRSSIAALEVGGTWHLLSPPRVEETSSLADCTTAVENGMTLSRPEMLKMSGMTATKLTLAREAVLLRCEIDGWSRDTRSCLADALTEDAVEACMRELSPTQMTKVTEELLRIAREE